MTYLMSSDCNILTIRGYFKTFLRYCQDSGTYREAYQKTEEELYQRHGINRYESYETFRQMKRRYFKKAIGPKS